jgi:DNA topoisomerase IB
MRLRRSDPAGSGLTRRRRGKGWQYLDESGAPADEDTCPRADALVIPPAWRDVGICPFPNGHIQAVGVDDAGRRQYICHEQPRRDRDEQKHDRVLEQAERLPKFRAAVEADLAGRGLTCAGVHAGAPRMLDRGGVPHGQRGILGRQSGSPRAQIDPPGGVADAEPADHGLGRSRGGWTTKLHLSAMNPTPLKHGLGHRSPGA